MRIAIAQFNPLVGDLDGNAKQVTAWAAQAHAQGVDLLITPELALCGYPPEDLLLRPDFLRRVEQVLAGLAQTLAAYPGLEVLVGHPAAAPGSPTGTDSVAAPPCVNRVSWLAGGQVVGVYDKRELPNYQVFDERRYFVSGRERGGQALVRAVAGRRWGVLICEDAWWPEPGDAAAAAGAQALIVVNASPYHVGKAADRESQMARRAQHQGMPLFYAHLQGGQDEVVFDGASFALDAQGQVVARAPAFEDHLLVMDWAPGADAPSGPIAPHLDPLEAVWRALVTGVRDYVGKNRFPGVILGLSGGIDSALVLAVAVDALGPDRVRTVMMPSRYTADMSWIDARHMAEGLGVSYEEIAIEPMVQAFASALAPAFAGLPEDTTEENIQARIRGVLLMALSNKTGRIVLTTGNKSEMATGYCTLYGDMAGGFAVIKDVAKTRVFELARWRNAQAQAQGLGAVIPERILTRPPSAELRADQKDQDSLPPYEILDAILAAHLEDNASRADLVAAGFDAATVDKVLRLVRINEYKRRQAPVGIRITHRAFGRDWRMPITCGDRP